MSEKLLQEILKELQKLNETQADNYVNLMNIDHKLNLLVDNEEAKNEFLAKKLDRDLSDILFEISDLQKKIVYHMPNFNGLEHVVIDAFSNVNETLKKIEKNTK